jgi:hypothetical protein
MKRRKKRRKKKRRKKRGRKRKRKRTARRIKPLEPSSGQRVGSERPPNQSAGVQRGDLADASVSRRRKKNGSTSISLNKPFRGRSGTCARAFGKSHRMPIADFCDVRLQFSTL